MSHGHQDPDTHRWEDDGGPPHPDERPASVFVAGKRYNVGAPFDQVELPFRQGPRSEHGAPDTPARQHGRRNP